MNYGILFLLMAALLVINAAMLAGWYLLLLWPAAVFVLVSLAYGKFGPDLFGKRTDGSRRLLATLALLPYLLYVAAIWHGLRLLSKEAAYNQLTERVWIGRRLIRDELPTRVGLVLDLTSEFSRPRGLPSELEYVACPMLDGAALPADKLVELVQQISTSGKVVYIHCAQGHGRTGLVAAIYLLASNTASTPTEAVAQVQAVRPGVRLNSTQFAQLEQAAALLAQRNKL